MNLLFIRSTLDPKNGGPVAALSQLTSTLGKLGHSCEVVTLDSPNDIGISIFPGVVHALGPGLGRYKFNIRLIPWLRRNLNRFDAVLVSGIWTFSSLAVWLVLRRRNIPYFVFIHGALDPWFKYAYPLKHLKKWLYWPWAEYQVLRDARGVFFTDEHERLLASQSFWLYRANEVVINYGINSPPGEKLLQKNAFLKKYPHLQGKNIILFIGRIHPKKGCDLLIDAFSRMAPIMPDLHLVMAGPDQEGWQSILMEQAGRLGGAGQMTWTGMLSGDLKWGAYHAADVFALPSHTENFGVAVAEALACRLPVLITEKVNIWREVVSDGAGFAEPDTPDGIHRLLCRWLGLSQEEKEVMRASALDSFLQRYEINKTADKFAKTLSNLIGKQAV